jgi:hypothetical protein
VTTISLNAGQQAAADAFMAFLFSPDKEFNISGPGGVGKTHLMKYLIDETMPRYHDMCRMIGAKPEYDDVHITATTNKAAEVLAQATGRPTETVHSFLKLKVQDNYETGVSKVTKTNSWTVHERIILFVDECSTIDFPLRKFIHEGTHNSKIVYVGDHCQLPPVMEPISPIYKDPMPFYQLTEPMRTNNPDLLAVNQQLRQTVETGIFQPIRIVPGVIDLLDEAQMMAALHETFREQTYDSRILAYSNARVLQYNDYIRAHVRGLPPEFTVGEYLVNNSSMQLKNGRLSVEEEITITKLGDPEMVYIDQDALGEDVYLQARRATIETSIGEVFSDVRIPMDKAHHRALMKYFARAPWSTYYNLKNNFPDLRQRDAATVHKAQGSSYDTVFIDLANISSCTHAHVVAKLLYVAFSRARLRVFLYGQLAPKYGGLII